MVFALRPFGHTFPVAHRLLWWYAVVLFYAVSVVMDRCRKTLPLCGHYRLSFTVEQLAAIDWDDPWWSLDLEDRELFESELAREVCDSHILAGKRVTAIARGGIGNDDSVIYYIHSDPPQLAIAHLTFCATRETSPKWPDAKIYATLDELLADLPNW
ncbi:MAG: hypothetical protein ABJZ55_13325 [Fuerstiella sp.]